MTVWTRTRTYRITSMLNIRRHEVGGKQWCKTIMEGWARWECDYQDCLPSALGWKNHFLIAFSQSPRLRCACYTTLPRYSREHLTLLAHAVRDELRPVWNNIEPKSKVPYRRIQHYRHQLLLGYGRRCLTSASKVLLYGVREQKSCSHVFYAMLELLLI